MLITPLSTQNDRPAHRSDDEGFRADILGSGAVPCARPIIFNDTSFRIVPTLGPLHRHHMLICARRQRSGIHQMPIHEINRLQSILDCTERVYSKMYGTRFVMFENGTRGAGQSGCSIRHFHFHVIPTKRSFDLRGSSERGFHAVEDLSAARRRALLLGDYQLLKTPGDKFFIRARGGLPSQYLRRRVAELNGISEWDWRKLRHATEWSDHSAAYSSLRAALVRDICTNGSH